MDPSAPGSAAVTVGSPAREVVHEVLTSLGWTIRSGRGMPDDRLEIIDLTCYRTCSATDLDARFPRTSQPGVCRACVLVCRPEEYPDAPHDRFDAIVTEPLTPERLSVLVMALFPPSGAADCARR